MTNQNDDDKPADDEERHDDPGEANEEKKVEPKEKGPSSDLAQKIRVATDTTGTPVGYTKTTIDNKKVDAAKAEEMVKPLNEPKEPSDAAEIPLSDAEEKTINKEKMMDNHQSIELGKTSNETTTTTTTEPAKDLVEAEKEKILKTDEPTKTVPAGNELSRQQLEDKLTAQELLLENRQGAVSLDEVAAEDIAFPTEPLQNRVISTPGAFAQVGVADTHEETPALEANVSLVSEATVPFNNEEDYFTRAASTDSVGAPLIKATLVEDDTNRPSTPNNFSKMVLVDAKPLGDSYRLRRFRCSRNRLIFLVAVCIAVVAGAVVLSTVMSSGSGGSDNSNNGSSNNLESKDEEQEPPTRSPLVATATEGPTRSPTASPHIAEPIFLGNSFDCSNLQECFDRPFFMGMQFRGGNCSTSNFSQGPDTVNCTDFPENGNFSVNSGEMYYLGVNEWLDGGSAGISLFEGVVRQGCAYNVLEEYGYILPSNIQIRVWPAVGNRNESTILQDVRFHASCSESLRAGDIFGSQQLVAFSNSGGTVRCSLGSTDICVSPHEHKYGCNTGYLGPDVSSTGGMPLLPGTHILLEEDLSCGQFESGIQVFGQLTLDCQGNAIISGTEPGQDGVYPHGVWLVGSKVQNCEIRGFFENGVEVHGGIVENVLVQNCTAGVTIRNDDGGGVGSILLGTLNNVTTILNSDHGIFVNPDVAKVKLGPGGVLACGNDLDIELGFGGLSAVDSSSSPDSVICTKGNPAFCQDDIVYFRDLCGNVGFPTPMPSASPSDSPSLDPSPSPSAVPTMSLQPSQHPSAAPSLAPTMSFEPTISMMPSTNPTTSSKPTISAMPSTSPTVSSVVVVVDLQLDGYPCDISWSITRLNFSEPEFSTDYFHLDFESDGFKFESHEVSLMPGFDYVFLIEDSYGDGLFDGAYYNISSLDGEGSFQGQGNFGYNETATFIVHGDGSISPYVRVVIYFWFDDYPYEISWSITEANSFEPLFYRDYANLSDDIQSLQEEVSLKPGFEYVFLIEDSFGDGFLDDGNCYLYDYGSNEVIAVFWGNFGHNETATFSILPDGSFVVDYDKDGFTDDVDCSDDDISIYPGAEELCDGIDNNCNGVIDEDCHQPSTAPSQA